MKVPINWLKDYVDVGDEQSLIDALTSVGHMQDGPPKKIGDENVYDLEVRQNRPDCLSILGVAREAAAVLDKKLKNPYEGLASIPSAKGNTKVVIDDPKLCYRFNTVTLESIKVGESPKWLVEKLTAYGIKSVNNVVDVTNFVMVELGQPLHAFDQEKIKDSTLIIRSAKKGETLTLLGQKKIELDKDDLVIADPDRVVALAGVMGGEDTGVSSSTKSIILEAATYNQATVRRSTLKHNVRTEASTRLEKFLHPHLTKLALQRATSLLQELTGAKVVDHTDEYPTKFEDKTVLLSQPRLELIGGVKISLDKAKKILEKLELPVSVNKNVLEVKIPFFRTDLEIEDDLVEEVLRIHGYDNIPATLPASPPPANIESKDYLLEEEVRDLMVAAGYDEQITEPLTKETDSKLTPVTLQNSLNSDKTMLRTTLSESLANALANQRKYRKSVVKIFEVGKIYFKEGKNYKEQRMLGVATSGVEYFQIKGVLELLVEQFGVKNVRNVSIQSLGANEYFFELPLDSFAASQIVKPLYEPPHVILQDISLFVSKDSKVGEMIEEIKKASKLLSNVSLGEDPIVKGAQKSVFLNLEFSSQKHNLTKEQVDTEKKSILQLLEKNYSATIRSS